jgi:hypothetical protein
VLVSLAAPAPVVARAWQRGALRVLVWLRAEGQVVLQVPDGLQAAERDEPPAEEQVALRVRDEPPVEEQVALQGSVWPQAEQKDVLQGSVWPQALEQGEQRVEVQGELRAGERGVLPVPDGLRAEEQLAVVLPAPDEQQRQAGQQDVLRCLVHSACPAPGPVLPAVLPRPASPRQEVWAPALCNWSKAVSPPPATLAARDPPSRTARD